MKKPSLSKKFDFTEIEKYFVSCIYFLKFEGVTVYVGMTRNLVKRITSHLLDRQKVFDEVEFIETEQDNLSESEKYYIETLTPKYNKSGVTKKYPCTVTFTASARTCTHCGVSFVGALHGRYHSDACKKAAYRERKKRKQNGNAQTSNELRTCARCGVQFIGALHGRYHSAACKQAAYRERKQRKATQFSLT